MDDKIFDNSENTGSEAMPENTSGEEKTGGGDSEFLIDGFAGKEVSEKKMAMEVYTIKMD